MGQMSAVAGMVVAAHAIGVNCVPGGDSQPLCIGSGVTAVTGAGIAVSFIVLDVALAVLSVVAAVSVVTKAGYSGWWVLICLVPVVGFVMALVFAFSKWPVLREVEMLRARAGGTRGYGPIPGYSGSQEPWGTGPGGPHPAEPPPAGSWLPVEPGTASDTPVHRPPGSAGTEPVGADTPLPPFGSVPASQGAGAGLPVPPRPAVPPVPPVPSARPPAGWYPTADGCRRYWDGTAWTDHYA